MPGSHCIYKGTKSIPNRSGDADLCRWGRFIFQQGEFGKKAALKGVFPELVAVSLAGRCAGGVVEAWPVTWPRRAPSPGGNPPSSAINLIGHWMSMLPRPITSGKRAAAPGRAAQE